jgi:hypothetical protein
VATTRKAPARRPTQLSAASPAIIELGGPTSGETIDVFTADGQVYGMPADVTAELALEGLERMAENEAAAIIWMLKEVFGKDGYAALKRTATAAQLRAVSDIVSDHILGAAEGN